MLYYVIESYKGNENIIFFGDQKAAYEVEDARRRELKKYDPDGVTRGVYTISEEAFKDRLVAVEKWERLTEEQKKETVVIDGKNYVKALLDTRSKLKEARKAAGLTREELAEKTGISARTIEGYEQGRRDFGSASVVDALKIADAVGVDVRSLI